ncbi:Rv2640c family ArsR-like transcriptional regulator [Williamsia sp.]|uniref:Rv2640c family ArsR-like transcriptional regulator n=1 Tax=Williamsia sp. TaxID=1872085 RepID=UPI002F92BE71
MPKALPVIDIASPICCAPVSAAPLTDDDALEIALRLKALADPVRIKMMSILLTADSGEACTSDLAELLTLSEATVSHHLGQLRKAGMVQSVRRGMNVFHAAHPDALNALRGVLDPDCCR